MDAWIVTMILLFIFGAIIAAFSLVAIFFFVPNTFEKLKNTDKYQGRKDVWAADLKKMKKMWMIPLVVGLLMWIPIIVDIANTSGSAGYQCDICKEMVTRTIDAGQYDLCSSCYQNFK